MKISKKWLQDYVFLPDSLSVEELARELTMRTVEVEGIENQGASLENIVVGVVKDAQKHPNADKLKLCQVDVGNETLQIVCGGSNVDAGMKVAVAKIGAKVLWHGQGEPIVMEKAAVRGVDSFGMICGADEIGLSALFPKKDEKEIVNLSHIKEKAGTPLAKALGLDDVTLEVDNKSLSNRPDLWGHVGMAREIGAIYRKNIKPYNPGVIKEGKGVDLKVKVENAKDCPRYMGVVVENISVAPSPEWLQNRLTAIGLRPINNIVDITNFVMMDIGQPLHAFDASKLGMKDGLVQIGVRRAKDDEQMKTLDGKNFSLSSDMLVITDSETPVALAGIMGGQNTEVDTNTKTLVLESANFEASLIRKTSTNLGIRTDASVRFEKSLDPAMCELALRRAVELILEIVPGARVVSSVTDIFDYTYTVDVLDIPVDFFAKKMGAAPTEKEIIRILEQLGFGVEKEKHILHIKVPTWRATKDVSLPEDIGEEVLRIWGYENVPATLPSFSSLPPKENKLKKLERHFREYVALESGFTESYNYSFESPEWLKKLGVDTSLHLELENPIAKDRPFIRRSLIPNLLENMESNLHRFEEVKLFEVGRTYKGEEAGERVESKSAELLPRQDTSFAAVYAKKGEAVPFWVLSELVQKVLDRLHIVYELKAAEKEQLEGFPFLHPGRCAFLFVSGEMVGRIAELHPAAQKNLGIDERVALLEINMNVLSDVMTETVIYNPLSLYPEVVRDLALVIDREKEHADMVKTILSVDSLVRNVELFDVYEGEHVEAGKKSLAYHITYRRDDKTLTTEEVDAVHKKVVETLHKVFGAEIRK